MSSPSLAACACWAIDNNLTRKLSSADPVVTATLKGLSAGSVNVALALLLGAEIDRPKPVDEESEERMLRMMLEANSRG